MASNRQVDAPSELSVTKPKSVDKTSPPGEGKAADLVRALDWKDAFWIAAGVCPLVLFSMGGIAGVAGNVSFLVWIVSMLMGFLQSFTYAEIAGMFSEKSGGASVYGAMAWLRYSKFIAPLSVWCNWFAWSPVLALGCSISAGYILNLFFAHDPSIASWTALSFHIPGLGSLKFNLTFFIGAMLMVLIFVIQHRGIQSTALIQKYLAAVVLLPLLLAGLTPFFTGDFQTDHFDTILPPQAANSSQDGTWDRAGWTLILGALYMAAWTTYAFETAVCYTSELKDPKRDTSRAIISSGMLCTIVFCLIPFTFQGVLSREQMLAPGIADGTGIAAALGDMLGGYRIVTKLYVVLMILALFSAIMTALAGSSRTLYQGSKDGWLPKFLSQVNDQGAPIGAMWADFGFNLFLLALASDSDGFYFVMAVSNVGYITFNFLNLNAGWIHRVDSGHLPRPWRAPTALIAFNTLLAFVNALFLGAGAKVWGYSSALWTGLAFAALIVPIFAFRHYVQDGGKFPEKSLEGLGLEEDAAAGNMGERKAGIMPYLVLILGLAEVLWANWFFELRA